MCSSAPCGLVGLIAAAHGSDSPSQGSNDQLSLQNIVSRHTGLWDFASCHFVTLLLYFLIQTGFFFVLLFWTSWEAAFYPLQLQASSHIKTMLCQYNNTKDSDGKEQVGSANASLVLLSVHHKDSLYITSLSIFTAKSECIYCISHSLIDLSDFSSLRVKNHCHMLHR